MASAKIRSRATVEVELIQLQVAVAASLTNAVRGFCSSSLDGVYTDRIDVCTDKVLGRFSLHSVICNYFGEIAQIVLVQEFESSDQAIIIVMAPITKSNPTESYTVYDYITAPGEDESFLDNVIALQELLLITT